MVNQTPNIIIYGNLSPYVSNASIVDENFKIWNHGRVESRLLKLFNLKTHIDFLEYHIVNIK